MRKLVKLQTNTHFIYNGNISEYLNPDFVYIPIKEGFHILVKEGDYIQKGLAVLENNLNKVLSPVSGTFIKIDKKHAGGKLTECMVIENDFHEKEKIYRGRKQVTEDGPSIVSALYEYYFKYIASILESKKINNLIINSIEDEPYIANNEYIINNYSKELLDMIDILTRAFNIPRATIAIKESDTKNIEKYMSKLGTYPNLTLTLIENKYLLGKPFFLLEYLELNDMDSLVIDVKTLLEMYNAIKYNKYQLETFITIAGPCVEKCEVVKVKIGTKLSDVIKEKVKVKKGNNLFILNGLMTGYEVNPKDTIITSSTTGVIIIPKEESSESRCNRCGLCFKVCPVKVNPKKVMDTKKVSSNCIDCGLCTYICPCHINLRKYLRGEHE